ncbi:AP2/ERF and B3 domain-containing transcription factor At1g50680-like [Phalaenopsis equestris]|uniref:AP2/ERF and B3 domain-containing transcription factor At1g50680-like n=1 Tax=Phalaenopsis equestris TaxID=78828 RepID=UPI0009E20974|nr:AP2/ERF and B3 domain-containing transcription factor At1g50680-like [Phalaenopsis equestris]
MSSPLRNEIIVMNLPRQLPVEGESSAFLSTQAIQRVNLPPLWYLGVVPQENGYWVAQILCIDRLISLGTFNSEVAAARAYDTAAITQYGDEFFRNFLLTSVTIHEPSFQSNYSNETIVEMIRNGSYELKLIHFVSNHPRNYHYRGPIEMPSCMDAIQEVFYKKMFHKELTLTDLEHQKVLILPIDARPFFPRVRSNRVQFWLEFKDRMNRTWAFQYFYWSRFQRSILTRGWSKFVSEMQLRADDIVVFYQCWDRRTHPEETFDMVDIIRGLRITRDELQGLS